MRLVHLLTPCECRERLLKERLHVIFYCFGLWLRAFRKYSGCFSKRYLPPLSDMTASTVLSTLQMFWYGLWNMEMVFCPLFTDKRWLSISATKVILVHSPSLTWIQSHGFSFIECNSSHLTNGVSEFIQFSFSTVVHWVSFCEVFETSSGISGPKSLAGYKLFRNTSSGEHKWLLIAKSPRSATCRVNGFHLYMLMYIAKAFFYSQRPRN